MMKLLDYIFFASFARDRSLWKKDSNWKILKGEINAWEQTAILRAKKVAFVFIQFILLGIVIFLCKHLHNLVTVRRFLIFSVLQIPAIFFGIKYRYRILNLKKLFFNIEKNLVYNSKFHWLIFFSFFGSFLLLIFVL